MQTHTASKVKHFFEYMLQLNQLTEKVIRSYEGFVHNWFPADWSGLEGVRLFEDCDAEDAFFEIDRQNITLADEAPPEPPDAIREWLSAEWTDEHGQLIMPIKREVRNTQGEMVIKRFADNPERVSLYKQWETRWNEWAKTLAHKRQVAKLYEEFFYLSQQLKREGETLELVVGKEIFCWDHPEANVGLIKHPLLTTRLQLDLDVDQGTISAKQNKPETKVEMSIFTGMQLPNMSQVLQLVTAIETAEITSDIADYLQQLVSLIDPNGEYIKDSVTSYEAKPNPMIYHDLFFSLRRKNVRIIREDLQSIIKAMEADQLEIPPSIYAIVGEETDAAWQSEDQSQTVTNQHKQLYFPLAANEQQKEIVRRLEKCEGVSIQGPPGTGKTHTIANLVSHFLAHGKKILITSQKASPLSVLKNKIPTGIRDLCVSVAGGGRESIQEIDRSIQAINEILGGNDVDTLASEMIKDQKELEQSKRAEAMQRKMLKTYMEKEGTPLQYQGETLLRHDVAKRLASAQISYDWILDDVKLAAGFPLTSAEFTELWRLKSDLSPQDLRLQKTDLPQVGTHLRDEDSIKKFFQQGESLRVHVAEGKKLANQYQLVLENAEIKQLLAQVEMIGQHQQLLADPIHRLFIDEIAAGGVREERWRSLISQLTEKIEELLRLHHVEATNEVHLPTKPLRQLACDIQLAKKLMKDGKKPTFFLLGKRRSLKYLFRAPVINHEPVQEIDDLDILENYVRYVMKKEELARIFNGYSKNIDQEPIPVEEPRFAHLLDERIKQFQWILQVMDQIQALQKQVEKLQMSQLNFYDAETYPVLQKELSRVLGYIEYLTWESQFHQESKKFMQRKQDQRAHLIWQEFHTTFAAQDVDSWVKNLQMLSDLYQQQEQVIKWAHLLQKLASILPLTAKTLEQSVGVVTSFPAHYETAFELRKLKTWLDETKDLNYEQIKRQIEQEQNRQKSLIHAIVNNATRKHQIERMTPTEKRALSAWKNNMKRYGKGTGKYAHIYLKQAREEMQKAQSAIPVWIMPVDQVLENFSISNEKFDLIIFDESSQCDLYSINVLLRGKKALVVGDDEQISPQAIGTSLEDVHQLADRYLTGVPNANLFDGSISLYEIAEQIFPKEGKLMLKEHFRCVPEIIQFSNDLSYHGQMLPLRLPLDKEKIEPPVVAIQVGDGYNEEHAHSVNQPEIDAIVRDIQQMVQDPTYQNQTMGVIVLQGKKQAELLTHRIHNAIGDQVFKEREIICGNPYVLQGDERDIIFVSMVVAANRRFNALNKTDHKQRFNVAASRAKNQMRLYHSVDLTDLKSTDLRYRLLSYCKHPSRTPEPIQDLQALCESQFERDILRWITDRGYRVTPQVRVGGYRIDFVIEGMQDRLAVECDGDKWHGPDRFEQDLQRQESLERAGWKFWRVRGREFYLNQSKAMESLWEKLDQLGIKPSVE